MKIRMTADSTCDLPLEILRDYRIGITPLSVIINGDVFSARRKRGSLCGRLQ